MNDVGVIEAVSALTATIDFGKKISSVLHTLGAQDRTIGSCDFVLIADGTTRVLTQLQELVQQGLNNSEAKPALFNQAGLNYVKLAVDEVRLVFLMFEGTSLKEHVGRRRADVITTNVKGTAKEEIEKRGTPVVIDELALIKKMDDLALLNSKKLIDWVNRLTDRLDDLKNHLHLIHQVVSVHDLTRSPDGMKDLRVIVDSYDRIQRFAEKTGMLSDYGRRPRGSRRRSVSKSSDSESDSDSDNGRPRQKKVTPKSSTETLKPRTFAECNERRASVNDVVEISTLPSFSPVPVSNEQSDTGIPVAPPNPCCGPNNPQVVDISNPLPKNQPPEYSEKERSVSMDQRMTTDASISSTPTIIGSPSLDEKSVPLQSDEKEVHQENSDASSVATYETRSSDATSVSSTSGNQYIKEMKSTKWRFKRFFRSKQSLETEIQNNLRDDNKYLSAYLLQGRKSRKVPHSDIHSVEWTHINTIIAQMKGNGWYETFTNLSPQEQRAYEEMMPENAELLALKIVKTNQRNAWARMLVRLAGGSNDLPHLKNGRIILAIIREEERDDDSSSLFSSSSSDSEDESPRLSRPPPPPSHPRFNPPFFRRPPPPPPPPPVNRFKSSPPAIPGSGCNPPHSGPCPPMSLQIRNSSPPAPGVPRHIVPNIKPLIVPDTEQHAMRRPNDISSIPVFKLLPPPAAPARSTNIGSVRISDVTPTTPQNENDATFALTAYESYTFRPRAPVDDSRPIAWGCCSVTHEIASQASLRVCVRNYAAAGNDIIADKMKLTEGQALQVARLVDGLNAHESDTRFMWTLAELSFFNLVGEPVHQQWNSLNTAVMHVTAVRQPLENLNAMQIFEDIRRCFEAPVFPPVHIDGATGSSSVPRPLWRPVRDSESCDSNSDSGSDGGRPRRNWRCWNKAIRIKLDPADKDVDLVKRLLKLWTSE